MTFDHLLGQRIVAQVLRLADRKLPSPAMAGEWAEWV